MTVDVTSFKAHAAGGRRDELQQCLPRSRLATARLSHQRQGPPFSQVERDPIDRPNVPDGALEDAFADREMDLQPLHLEKQLPSGRLGARLSLGTRFARRCHALLPQVAAYGVTGYRLEQMRRFDPAAIEDELAAVGESAVIELPGQRRHLP